MIIDTTGAVSASAAVSQTLISSSLQGVDAGITIGKRYARTDELGVPFAITVDYDTTTAGALKDTVTLRERDSMGQRRVPIADVVAVLKALCDPNEGSMTWADVAAKYPEQAPPSDE